jgi:hypothetical protein
MDTLLDMQQKPTKKNLLIGICGQSILAKLEQFDIIRGCPVDPMHSPCVGWVSQLLELWFDSLSHNFDYYIGLQMELIDSRLLGFKLPTTSLSVFLNFLSSSFSY